jgi:hypothetical protein
LEQENLQLKWEMARLRTETGRLRELLLAEDSEAAMDAVQAAQEKCAEHC